MRRGTNYRHKQGGREDVTTLFVSYRRDDCAHPAGRLRDRLIDTLGARNIFFDVDSVAAGEDFASKIEQALSRCDSVLVLIGPRWNPPKADGSGRMLDDPDDWVRVEVARSLRSNAKVIPVLIDGTQMPLRAELPPDLADLSGRNAVPLRSGADFSRDVDTIINAIGGPRRRWLIGASLAGVLLIAASAAAYHFISAATSSQTPAPTQKLLAAMELPEPEDGQAELITNERMAGEKYGIVNNKPWRRTALVTADGSLREFFQPRPVVIEQRAWILYLAKAWEENEIYVYELALGEDSPYLVDRLAYKPDSGYHFDSIHNLTVSGQIVQYFGNRGASGRRYRIGSRQQAEPADFFPPDDSGPLTATSPNRRYIVAPIAGGNWGVADGDYALATRGLNQSGEFAGLSMYDRKQNANSILFQQQYSGDWSIGNIIWSDNSESVYFDNAGAVACIWQYEISSRVLRKIVPEHEAHNPQFLRYQGREYVVYVETKNSAQADVSSRLMIATE